MFCFSCEFLAKRKNALIYSGKYWIVDHAYRSKLAGWLVIILKRHAEALHELTDEEFKELTELIKKTTKLLYEVLHTEKEYVAFFAEGEGFHHIHMHVIPKHKGLPAELKGPKIFSMLKPANDSEIPEKKIKRIKFLIKKKFIRLTQLYVIII